jgi:hypothetical protein
MDPDWHCFDTIPNGDSPARQGAFIAVQELDIFMGTMNQHHP